MKAIHHIDPRSPETIIVDVSENRKKPECAEVEAKARALVYRTLSAEFIIGNQVSHDQIDEMIQRVIRDMGY